MSKQILRRRLCVAATLLLITHPTLSAERAPMIEVWKSPTCGCCKEWVRHMEQNGFSVKANDTGNNGIRERLGLPRKYGACHTAVVAGYVVEGHVPADDVARLLKTKPNALGIAVPRMPIGSPGMDGPAFGGRRDPYDVLLIHKDGTASVFQSHGK